MATFIRCDRCGKEIGTETLDEFSVTTGGVDAYIVTVTVSRPKNAETDLCKSCIVDVIEGRKYVTTADREAIAK